MNGQAIADALASALAVIPGVRIYPYPADTFLPPGIAVGRPDQDFTTDRTFCTKTWLYPVTVAVSRNTDREAMTTLYSTMEAVEDVLSEDHDLGGLVQTARILEGHPVTVPSQGQEFPAHTYTVSVLA